MFIFLLIQSCVRLSETGLERKNSPYTPISAKNAVKIYTSSTLDSLKEGAGPNATLPQRITVAVAFADAPKE